MTIYNSITGRPIRASKQLLKLANTDKRIEQYDCDEDGHWLSLSPGWCADDPGLHMLREDTVKESLIALQNTQRCACECCKPLNT